MFHPCNLILARSEILKITITVFAISWADIFVPQNKFRGKHKNFTKGAFSVRKKKEYGKLDLQYLT